MNKQNIYTIGSLITAGLITWGTISSVRLAQRNTENEELKKEMAEQEQYRINQYNDLVNRHNNNVEALKKTREKKREIKQREKNTSYAFHNLQEEQEQLKNKYENQQEQKDSLKMVLQDVKDEKSELELTLENFEDKVNGLKIDITEYQKNLETMKKQKTDSLNKMQRSIYGLLASPWWTRSPRPDRNNVPENVRFIPETREDVTTYRQKLNPKYE